jgi:serine phosphatase RsbU (regulator of sigma subunit)
MSLRLRLIVAFFFLSVVPLAAVTLYTYASNAAAMREAAGHEAESLAGDLTERMQLVTTQISERVEHLMDVQRVADATTAATAPRATGPDAPLGARPSTAPPVSPAPEKTNAAPAGEDSVAAALGEVAMLLNNIEVRGLRPLGPRGGPPPPGVSPSSDGRGGPPRGMRDDRGRRGDVVIAVPVPPPSPIPPPAPAAAPAAATGAAAPAPSAAQPVPPALPGTATDAAPPAPQVEASRDAGADRPPGRRPGVDFDRGRATSERGLRGAVPDFGAGRVGALPPDGNVPAAGADADRDRIMFDMMPIRREMIQQLVGSSEEWQKLSPEERQKVIGEVNQRMLGIVQGIQMGAAELQKKVSEAQRLADEKARATALAAASRQAAAVRSRAVAAATPAARAAQATVSAPRAGDAPVGTSGPTRRRTAFTGSRLDVTVERNGKVLREANAEVNMPNLLATVFTTTRRERGEVPFAFGKDGRLYTPTDGDRQKIESLGGVVSPNAPPGTTVLPDWIVVTTADPTGSGLKFGIARPVGESLNELRRASARNAGLGLACIGLALIGIVPISSRLTRNLSTLNDGVHRIAEGDYSARVQVRSNDEVGKLARAFNQMAEDVERHQHAVVEQERIRRELELGRQIQHDMLPQGPLRLGLTEIKGVSVPAREVGGDFFNYFALSDGDLALLVGDVSGKGVGAALLMANIQASLRTRLALGQDLASIAREIDVDIEGNTPGPVYATLFVGMLNPETRLLRYVNAGHNPQYVLRRDGRLEQMSSSGLPVGLLAGHGYTEDRVQLAAGDLLFFYTDGCVEAESEAGEMFGAERLEALLKSSAGAEDLLARVEGAVKVFSGTAEPFDDATMMVVKVG